MSYPCQKIKIWKINGLMLYQVAFLNDTFSFVQILNTCVLSMQGSNLENPT